MSFRLRMVVVYNLAGQTRTVEFRKQGLSVVTGVAKTGKSAIVDIIDYCLGRSECYVAEGVIRQQTSWFGVELENDDDIVFLARRCPGGSRRTSPDIFVRRGEFGALPHYDDLHKNTTEEGLTSLVTRFSGISENEHRPVTGSRRPLQATIRHALFLCFQKQDEIASRDRLFHRQGEQFIPQAIKDTFPYFLGAVDEEHFLRQNELDDARMLLRDVESQRDTMRGSGEVARERVRRLLRDARRVGLVSEDVDPDTIEDGISLLREASQADLRSPETVAVASEAIGDLESELRGLQQQLNDVVNDTRATQHFIREQTSFTREASEQQARLTALDLYTGTTEADHVCPVCETPLETPTPSQADLTQSLRELDRQLEAVGSERPHLQERLDELGKRRANLVDAIVSAQRDLERAYADNERARRQRDETIERARVLGRISAVVDDAAEDEDLTAAEARVEEVRRRVEMLEERVNIDDMEERVLTFLNLIADYMTEYAAALDLEHAEGRIRLDLKRLSVVAETVNGPIPLYRIGSGENWVGYHVVTLLALHRWFREQQRPIPGFLVFDQPSQAHYPPDTDVDVVEDADRQAVHRLFELMNEASNSIGEGFQLIVLDHARFEDEWFEAAIVEEWRGGTGLIPAGWLETS